MNATALSTSNVCMTGHYCMAGSSVADPVGQPYGDECPTGEKYNISMIIKTRIRMSIDLILFREMFYIVHLLLVLSEGSYCPEGSPVAIQCAAGTYQDQVRQASCDSCPAGFYCTLGTSTPVVCPAGHYCPVGSVDGNTNACPTGTFNVNTQQDDVADCLSCSPG